MLLCTQPVRSIALIISTRLLLFIYELYGITESMHIQGPFLLVFSLPFLLRKEMRLKQCTPACNYTIRPVCAFCLVGLLHCFVSY